MNSKFVIKCIRCGWAEATSGIKGDLNKFYEIKNACRTCGKKNRTFRCPKCGHQAQLKHIRD